MCTSLLAIAPLATAAAAKAKEGALLIVLQQGNLQGYALEQGMSRPQPLQINSVAMKSRHPLGSLWKIFAFSYLMEHKPVAPYHCHGHDQKGGYCSLTRGHGTVDLNTALIHSCELAFRHYKSLIPANAWRTYWQKISGNSAEAWIFDLAEFGAELKVEPAQVLNLLGRIRLHAASWPALDAALTQIAFTGTARSLSPYGSNTNLKIKTFTMGNSKEGYFGGIAGWFNKSTLFWLAGPDKSGRIASAWFPTMTRLVKSGSPQIPDESPVKICTQFLERYPLLAVKNTVGNAVKPGPLYGHFVAETTRETAVEFESAGDVSLKIKKGQPQLTGCFSLEEYVARVVEREGSTLPFEAKKALGIAARTYALRHSKKLGADYLSLPDSTNYQRVALTKPDQENQRAAGETAGLIVDADVFYHQDRQNGATMSLKEAKRQALAGVGFRQIVQIAYGKKLLPFSGLKDLPCQEMKTAKDWLKHNLELWQPRLAMIGANMATPFKICSLDGKEALYFDNRIYMQGLHTTDDQITLVHEWLHAALAHTPQGRNEEKIERLARSLVLN